MNEAELLVKDFNDCASLACKCSMCGSKPLMAYEVGTTYFSCLECNVVAAMPDWNPRSCLRVWNTLQLQPEINIETANKITNKMLEK